MKIRIGTFNLENLFLRYRILDGDRSGTFNPKPIPFTDISKFISTYTHYIEKFGGAEKLESDPKAREKLYKELASTNKGNKILAKFLLEGVSINNLQIDQLYAFNETQRKGTAKAIRGEDNEMIFPDIMALQEVENMQALRDFDSAHFDKHYKFRYLIDGNDNRQIDVGFYSNFPATRIRTHQFTKDSNGTPLFSRDCLEVDFALTDDENKIDNSTPILTIFNNHLKSKFIDFRVKESDREKAKQSADSKRKRQADEISSILKERFKGNDFEKRNFIVCGDFNDNASSPALTKLLNSRMENVVNRIDNGNINKEWTYYYSKENTLEQMDYILLSPALSKNNKSNKPQIERRGMANYRKLKSDHNFDLKRFEGVTKRGTEASESLPNFHGVKYRITNESITYTLQKILSLKFDHPIYLSYIGNISNIPTYNQLCFPEYEINKKVF